MVGVYNKLIRMILLLFIAADISCNFESDNTCSWAVETHEDDDFMWHVQQQEATSRILGTGPKQDHTHFPNDTGNTFTNK